MTRAPAADDLRPRGAVAVLCSTPGCSWTLWVDALDPTLPDGPFVCLACFIAAGNEVTPAEPPR